MLNDIIKYISQHISQIHNTQRFNQSINQSVNMAFVGRRYTTRPEAPTIVSGKHDQNVHSWVVFWMSSHTTQLTSPRHFSFPRLMYCYCDIVGHWKQHPVRRNLVPVNTRNFHLGNFEFQKVWLPACSDSPLVWPIDIAHQTSHKHMPWWISKQCYY